MKKVDKYGLKISSTLYEFINNEVFPNIDLNNEEFWKYFSEVVHELSPENRALIQKRESIQKRIDDWHKSNKSDGDNKERSFGKSRDWHKSKKTGSDKRERSFDKAHDRTKSKKNGNFKDKPFNRANDQSKSKRSNKPFNRDSAARKQTA